ncbi:hypothetical protein [Metabacillus niabensis]|uniref:Uncharacterized protein n=1 Tax=Metabacillus niabensis TaxID=324854 RepID=A0ABT9Z830_9BACI|nr:hypothetical protein [Metabacillus niabensis]MDQ0228429.1 hypothetical protein [Metabacillus niabensis]
MNIEQARNKIKELENFIKMVENYGADTFEKEAIKLYVLKENVTIVANELNKKGYRVGNRKVVGKDVSDIIRLKPTDEMHSLATKMFGKNIKRVVRR